MIQEKRVLNHQVRVAGRLRPWLVLGIYAGLTIFITQPIVFHLGTHIPGSEGDAWVHQWTFRWVKEILTQGGNLFYTDRLYYPGGASLLYHNFAWLHIALWLPLQAVTDEATAYALIFMGGFAFTGFTTYLFARELVSGEAAAFMAGLIGGFWPYNLSHHNHPNLIFIGFIPLTLLYLKRTFESRRLQDALLTGFFLALVGITRWQLLIMGGFLVGMYWVYLLGTHVGGQPAPVGRKPSLMRLLGLTAVTGLVALLLMLPLLLPLLVGQFTRSHPEDLYAGELGSGYTDLLAYVVPSRYHPLWGSWAFDLTENFIANRVFTPFIGFVVLALVIYALVYKRRAVRFWLPVALIYIVLALGTHLHLNGWTGLPLPGVLIEDTLIMRMMRRTDRFNVILCIPVAMLAAFGVQALLQHVKDGWQRPLVAGGFILLILFEYSVKYPLYELYTPAWYAQLAQEDGAFAILDLPIHRRSYDEAYMYYQFTHGKPLVGGHISRPPRETFDFIDGVPFLRDFRLDKEPIPEIVNVGHQLRLLSQAGVPYLTLHKEFLEPDKLQRWKEWLWINPVYEDADLVVYHTRLVEGEAYVFKGKFSGDLGVGVLHSTITPTATTQDGWLNVNIVWGSDLPVKQDYDVCLNIMNQRGLLRQWRCETLSPRWPTSNWRSGELVHTQYLLQLSPYLDSGEYDVVATVRQNGESVGRPVYLDTVSLSARPRTFETPLPEKRTSLIWDDKIRLHGYDLSLAEQSLDVTLHWQALQRMSTSYVVFLHLIDLDTGQLAAQIDAAPRNWTYPTNWWEAEEFVSDTLRLSLANVPAGEYQLNVGLYHAETGERLPVNSAAVAAYPDRVVPLEVLRR